MKPRVTYSRLGSWAVYRRIGDLVEWTLCGPGEGGRKLALHIAHDLAEKQAALIRAT